MVEPSSVYIERLGLRVIRSPAAKASLANPRAEIQQGALTVCWLVHNNGM